MSEQFQTKDQERAAFAWEAVGDSPKEDFVNLAKGAASLVMENGLMQALAFWESKSGKGNANANANANAKDNDNANTRIVEGVCAWLKTQGLSRKPDFSSTMESLQQADGLTYLRATVEALAILRWIRLFADARWSAKQGKEDA